MKKFVEGKPEDLEIHFVYAGDFDNYRGENNELVSFILKGMKKYKLKLAMVTKISISRCYLITKEQMKQYCEWKVSNNIRISVNDDLESLLEHLQHGCKPNEGVGVYFLPKLTQDELLLVKRKDPNYLGSFLLGRGADIGEAAMQASESDSKFLCAYGVRKTIAYKKL